MKLILMLKMAYAIEIGAYEAYQGHRKSYDLDSAERSKILEIQWDELAHKEILGDILDELGHKPSKLANGLLWLIGKTISFVCSFAGYRACAFGAKIMEILGSNTYERLAKQASKDGREDLAKDFQIMARQEKSHEEYFRSLR